MRHMPPTFLMNKHARILSLLLLIVVTFQIIGTASQAQAFSTEQAFSPDQGATALVVKTIKEAKQSIRMAAYSFTSKPIAEALVAAQVKGIEVRVVLDKSQRKAKRTVLHYLRWHHVPTRINNHYAIMHNKFIIIDGKVLELGSFNYTKSAETKNAENVLVLRDALKVIQEYSWQWEKLWNEGE